MNEFWAHWYIHIPNFALAAVAYTLVGRFVLGLFVPENWDNYIWRFFRLITDPFVKVVRFVTPQLLSHTIVVVFGILWLMAIRLAYLVTLINLGLGPSSS